MAFPKCFLLALALISIAATCVGGSTTMVKAGTSSVTDSPEHKALMFRPFTIHVLGVPGVVSRPFFGRHLTQTNATTCPVNYKTCPPYTATVLNCVPSVFTCCPLPVGGSCPPGFSCQLYQGAVPYCYAAASILQSQIVMIMGALAVALFMMFSTSERF